jgi:hypothetical protein
VFTNTFIKIGDHVLNEAAIMFIDLNDVELSDDPKVAPKQGVSVWMAGHPVPLFFPGPEADALRRLFASDPEIWAQREGPGWCGVLDLTPEGP